MDEAFKRTSGTGIKHFFLGDTEEIHSDLKNILNKKYEIRFQEVTVRLSVNGMKWKHQNH